MIFWGVQGCLGEVRWIKGALICTLDFSPINIHDSLIRVVTFFQLTWRSQEPQISKCPHLMSILITGFWTFHEFLPIFKVFEKRQLHMITLQWLIDSPIHFALFVWPKLYSVSNCLPQLNPVLSCENDCSSVAIKCIIRNTPMKRFPSSMCFEYVTVNRHCVCGYKHHPWPMLGKCWQRLWTNLDQHDMWTTPSTQFAAQPIPGSLEY